MIVKDLIIQLLEMPQHKEVVVDVDIEGLLPLSKVVVDDSTNSVVISLEE